jgi:hypothetical protein
MPSQSSLVLLYSLLGLFIISNLAAIVFGKPSPDRTRRAIPWLQRSTSLQLAIMAWLFWGLGARDTPLAGYALLIALGMSLSFIADLIMAEIIRLPNRVLGGIVTFGLAHLIYLGAYISGGTVLGLLRPELLIGSAIFWLVVGFAVWYRWVRHPSLAPLSNASSLGYTLLITVMVAGAGALVLADGRMWLPFGGAVLFLASDVILGNQIFHRHTWLYVGEVVWVMYILGQAGIVWSILLALRLL